MDQKAYWIGFNKIRGIGAVRFQQLLSFFGSLEIAWNAPLDSLRRAGLGEKVANSFIETRSKLDLEAEIGKISKLGIQVLTLQDESYPRRLKEIDQPPPVLFVKGKLLPQDDWAVAIVGTRQNSAYGRQLTEELAGFLAQNKVTVISGLARGIDIVAHEAALKAGGRTIAVLGCGVDQIYPPEHRIFAEKMMKNGALVSEYALGTPPDGINFPPRNRIISGLSLSTVVVEAGETSGALITATFAVNQGREVFAVPGNYYSPKSKGTNRLIRDGARPLLDFNDILEILQLNHVDDFHFAQIALPSDKTEKILFDALCNDSLHIDDILAFTGLPVEKVSAALVMMELKGLVRQVNPMTYSAIKEDYADYKENKNE
jgi:DNA processing protein